MVLNTCPGGAAVESPELPPPHHPLRASDVCICGETNKYIKDYAQTSVGFWQTTALQAQQKLMLDLHSRGMCCA